MPAALGDNDFRLSDSDPPIFDSFNSFANGIELDPSGDFLLFCESGRARLHKLHLTGPRAGDTEVLIDSLPGLPDNIKLNDNGHYYVGLISPRLPGKRHLMEIIGPHYLVRRFLVRLITLVMIPIRFLNSVIPISMIMKVRSKYQTREK